jgi:hypothetical protein
MVKNNYQKGTYYMGLNVFNSLPSYIKVKINDLMNLNN